MSIILTQFGATTENLRFCEVWSDDRYGVIKNATRKYFESETRLLEIVLELPRYWDRFWIILGYFWLFGSTCLHIKLPLFTALFFRTDFTVACVFRKRSTTTIGLPRLQFGRRISRLRKFRWQNCKV